MPWPRSQSGVAEFPARRPAAITLEDPDLLLGPPGLGHCPPTGAVRIGPSTNACSWSQEVSLRGPGCLVSWEPRSCVEGKRRF